MVYGIIKFKRGTSVEWSALNPLLAEGEPGYETDSHRTKVGDGVTRWNQLPYSTGATSGLTMQDLTNHVNSETPHPVYDDGPSLILLYENAKV